MTHIVPFVLRQGVTERLLTTEPTVAAELLGSQTRFVTGARFRHRIIESGEHGKPPLMLLHGIGGHAECWARNLNSLGQHFHVVAPDLLFHGLSSHEPWDASRWIELIADGIIDLMDAMGWHEAHIQGESLGAHVTFNLALRHRARLDRIILNTGLPRVQFPGEEVITKPGGRSGLSSLSQQVVTEPTYEAMRKRMQWLVCKPERMTEDMVHIRLALYRNPSINAAMARIYGIGAPAPTLPVYTPAQVVSMDRQTLVFWTEHNPDKGPDYARRITALMRNAKFYVMADAGHWPQWEKPAEHDQVLLEFLLR